MATFTLWENDFDIYDWVKEWNALIVLWERETQSKWKGDIKPLIEWIDEAGNDSAAALISEAKAKCAEWKAAHPLIKLR